MTTGKQKRESVSEEAHSLTNYILRVCAGMAALVLTGTLAADYYQYASNRDAVEKKAPLMAQFNGHAHMVTGVDTISEISIGTDYKIESVVSYDFARSTALHGPKSTTPGAVLGFNQLPHEMTGGMRESVCQATKTAVARGVEPGREVRTFLDKHCQP